MMFRLAYIVTHPIQYQVPLFRLLAASGRIQLKVFFFSDFSLHAHYEKAFGRSFKWDVNLTDGYDWEVLPRWGIGHSEALRPYWPVRGLKERLKVGHFDAVAVHGWGGHIGLLQALSAVNLLGIPILLRGACRLLQQTPPIIFLATHSQSLHTACCELLVSAGYKLEGVDGRLVEVSDELICHPPRR